MDKVYKIFISSCKRMLEKERQIISETILINNHIPVQMEYHFLGSNSEYSIEIDKRKIQESDCVIFILSYLYGELIGGKFDNRNECPIKDNQHENCESCKSRTGCRLSFTHFEYEYAKKLNKPIIVLVQEKYNDDNAFYVDNEKYIKNDGKDCKSIYFSGKEKNENFIADVLNHHSLIFKDIDSFITSSTRAVQNAIALIKEEENKGFALGLVPHSHYSELESRFSEIETAFNHIRTKGIEYVYDSQTTVLKALAEDTIENVYYGKDGKAKDIKVLAIRGASFAGVMGHDWTRFILDNEFKPEENINVEFILSNYKNEELIEERYTAFTKEKNSNQEALEKYKKEYMDEMKTVQQRIFEYQKTHPCRLFLHNESKLLFRMVFMGDYLYLSSFLKYKKAAESPVMKIASSSSLYELCKEYYEWVKKGSIEKNFIL